MAPSPAARPRRISHFCAAGYAMDTSRSPSPESVGDLCLILGDRHRYSASPLIRPAPTRGLKLALAGGDLEYADERVLRLFIRGSTCSCAYASQPIVRAPL